MCEIAAALDGMAIRAATETMEIRAETHADIAVIREVVTAAFANAPHRSGSEAEIVERLREAARLTLSLVAEENGEIVGHVAFSRVEISGGANGWFGLGPLAVAPNRQRRGIGHLLVSAGLAQLRNSFAAGCVVLGDPAYYGRFGFESDPTLVYPNVPPEDFQRLSFDGSRPAGVVAYHESFLVA